MPKYRKEVEPNAQSDNNQDNQKGESTESPRRKTGLRKSETSGKQDSERTLLGRVFRKRKPVIEEDKTLKIASAPTYETPVIIAPKGAEDILAHLSWRPRQAAPPPVDQEKPRPKRAPRNADPREKPEPRVKPEPPSKRPPKKEEPKPKWETIRIPEDAAQVIFHEGVPTIVHKKKIVTPLFLSVPVVHDKRVETVLDEVKMAGEKGIHAIALLLDLTVDDSLVPKVAEEAIAFVQMISEANPDAMIVVRAQLIAPKGWQKIYKKAVFASKDESEPSICDDEYWLAAENAVKNFVSAVNQSDVSKFVIGMHVDRHGWFNNNGSTHDVSTSSKEKFSVWLRQRYRDDKVSLRAAWFDGKVDFDTISVPPPTNGSGSEEFVRIGRSGRRWVDYNLFLSDVTVDRIAQIAYTIKKESVGLWLVGTNYGYTFEWSYPASGHLSLGKLLRCPSIDYVSGPSSYKAREPGSSSPFPGPIDSFALNGKVFISEDDFKTPISGDQKDSHSQVPLMKTPQSLESAHWRSVGSALVHSSGASWIDLTGEGWLASRGIWDRAGVVKNALNSRIVAQSSLADVAVLIDERSLAYLVDTRAFEVLVQNVRESVLRSGLSANFYLLSDLAHRENFPDAKLYLFLNAWDIRPEVRSAIKSRLQKDNKVLFWLYCAGLFEAGRDALERVREVTGIALKPQPFHSKPGTTLLNVRHPLCASLPPERMAGGGQLEPSYFALPEDGLVLGEYLQTGLPSFVMREFKGTGENEGSWKTVFLGEPVVTPGLFRALGQMAGAHIWNFDDDVVHAKPPYLTVHCKGAGQRTITLPNNWCAYDLLKGDWVNTESNSLKFNAIDGATYVFYVGVRSDVEALLKTVPPALLTLEKIEPRSENTVHWDSVQFDVEIMKLDEWVEENWTEQHADDLLLKPSMIDADQEEEDVAEEDRPLSSGQRRGRGRGRRGNDHRKRGGRGYEEKADIEFQEAGVGVMFRKKQ